MGGSGLIPVLGSQSAMRLLNNLKIGVKLPVFMVLIGALSLLLAEQIATRYTRDTVLQAGTERLAAVARARATEMRSTLAAIRTDVRANLANPVILGAARAFVHAHDRYGPGRDADLRRLYVDENPNRAPRRSRLVDPDDQSSYTLVHRRYHNFFLSRVSGRGFSDLYLVAPDGRVVYSVEKGPLFGRNILDDPELDPEFADVFQRALLGAGISALAASDFKSRPAGAREASALFGVPVSSPIGTIEAVLIKRVPVSRFEEIASRPAGLGRTGEVLFFGQDRRLRVGFPPDLERDVRLAEAEADPFSRAMAGQSGALRHADTSGRQLLTAFDAIDGSGHRYAILVRQAEAEILSAASQIREGMLNEGAVALSFVTVLGLALARSMSVPLSRVGEAMARVGAGNYEDAIPDRRRRDELGGIARRLDAFRASLLLAESAMRENAFKGSAFQSTAAALMITDKDLTIIHVNGAMVELATRNRIAIDRHVPGFRPDALPGRNLSAFFPGAGALRARVSGKCAGSAEVRFGQRHFKLAMSAVDDGAGGHLGFVVEWADVTDERMKQVLLGVVDARFPIAAFSADGRILQSNALFERWCAAESGELVGRSWDWMFCRAEQVVANPPNPRWAEVVAAGREPDVELLPLASDRPALPASISAVRDAAGHLQRYVLIGSQQAVLERNETENDDVPRFFGAAG